MLLTRIEASGFRNLEGFAEFGPGLNIFYGETLRVRPTGLKRPTFWATRNRFAPARFANALRSTNLKLCCEEKPCVARLTKQIQLLIAF